MKSYRNKKYVPKRNSCQDRKTDARPAIRYPSPEDRKSRQGPEWAPIGNVLNQVMRQYRRDGDVELLSLWKVWPDAVGETIAENTKPFAFRSGRLTVHVSSSPWMHQLQFLKKDIIAKTNQLLGRPLITDIKFKIGAL